MPEIVVCNLCGKNDTDHLRDKTELLRLPEPYQIVRCRNCGLVYQNPRMNESEYKEYYSQGYYDGWDYLKNQENKTGEYLDKYIKLEKIFPTKGLFLDVGCGTGHFLDVGKKRGWEVVGTEVSEWSANYANENFGIEIRQCTLENAKFESNRFDVVNLSHVAEHLPNPIETLREAYRIMKKEGILLLEVPNEFNDLLFLMVGSYGRRRLYQYPGPVMHHTYYFTRNTLAQVLKKSGFIPMSICMMNKHSFIASNMPGGKIIKNIAYRFGALIGRGPVLEILSKKQINGSDTS